MGKLSVIAAAILLGVSTAHATTYSIKDDEGGVNTIAGTITTDGTIGVLSQQNILSWNVTVKDGQHGETIVLTPANTENIDVQGQSLTADQSGLFFNPDLPGGLFLLSTNVDDPVWAGFLYTQTFFAIWACPGCDGVSGISRDGLVQIGADPVPLPGAAFLFAGGQIGRAHV